MARKYIQMGKTNAENTTAINENFAELYSIYDDVEQLKIDVDALETNMSTAQQNISTLQGNVSNINTWQESVDAALYDSGWIDLALGVGWTIQSDLNTERPMYRKVGKLVMLRGLINATETASDTLGNLPVGFRPSATNYNRFACVLGQTNIVPVLVATDGNIVDYTKGAQTRDFLCLDGIRFFID